MITSEQERAADALEKVLSLRGESEKLQKRYRAYVDRLGPMIIMNSLGQALATEMAAAGPDLQEEDAKAHSKLFENISDWLRREPKGVYAGADDLIKAIVSSPQSLYLRAQTEALAWLEWHKRFSRAYLPRDTETDAT